jgi:hypothetical protein
VKKGDRLVALEDFRAYASIHWFAPMTTGCHCVVPKGTTLVSKDDAQPPYGYFRCVPEDEKEFEEKYIPQEQRAGDEQYSYAGYSFGLSSKDFGRKLKKLEQ